MSSLHEDKVGYFAMKDESDEDEANVCVKCGPLNLTHTSTWSLFAASSQNEHQNFHPKIIQQDDLLPSI